MSCVINKDNNETEEEFLKLGLIINHAYSVLDFIKLETAQRKDVYLFKIRNPWAKIE